MTHLIPGVGWWTCITVTVPRDFCRQVLRYPARTSFNAGNAHSLYSRSVHDELLAKAVCHNYACMGIKSSFWVKFVHGCEFSNIRYNLKTDYSSVNLMFNNWYCFTFILVEALTTYLWLHLFNYIQGIPQQFVQAFLTATLLQK